MEHTGVESYNTIKGDEARCEVRGLSEAKRDCTVATDRLNTHSFQQVFRGPLSVQGMSKNHVLSVWYVDR